jgi:hypothetical protein
MQMENTVVEKKLRILLFGRTKLPSPIKAKIMNLKKILILIQFRGICLNKTVEATASTVLFYKLGFIGMFAQTRWIVSSTFSKVALHA